MLYRGAVVEMSAGEGKTVAAAFPAILHALTDRRVHVVTANDYLAARDAEWLADVHEALGISVAAVLGHMGDDDRRAAYRSRIVYGTVRELGFDFLRDNMKLSADETVQRERDVAIVDEADQTLIDEAGTPLIISGGPPANTRGLRRADQAVRQLISRQARPSQPASRPSSGGPISRPDIGARSLLARLSLADHENEHVDPGAVRRQAAAPSGQDRGRRPRAGQRARARPLLRRRRPRPDRHPDGRRQRARRGQPGTALRPVRSGRTSAPYRERP